MATLEQLESEAWWGREITTSPMVGLGLQLRAAHGTGAGSVGIKGNEVHLSGGHRSQEWLTKSRYCTNRVYAVQPSLVGDEYRYVAALDFTPGVWGSADNRAKMRVLTKRMLDAMRSGFCDEVLECFGTLDGVHVAGWRNDLNQTATSDTSHLDHLHLRFNRRFCNDNAVMIKVAAILLGDDFMTLDASDANVVWYTKNLPSGTPTMTPATALLSAQQRAGHAADNTDTLLTDAEQLKTDVAQLRTDVAAILEALRAIGSGAPAVLSGTWTTGTAVQ
jgi:hypothetical protein